MAHKHSISGGIVEVDNSTLHETKEDIRLDQLLPPEILEDKTKLEELLQSYYTFMNMDEFIYQETETFSDVILDNVARFRISDPNNTNSKFFTDETGASSTLTLTSPTGDSPAEFSFNGSSSSIVNTTDKTLDLTEFQQKALPVGTIIIYDTGDGTAIGGLSDDTQYFVVFSQDSSIQLSLTENGSAINLSAVGTGRAHTIKGALATMNIPLSDINVAITNGNNLPGSLAESTSEIGKTFTVNGLSSFNNYTASLTTIVKYWVGPGPSWVMNNIEAAMDIDRNETNYLELMQKEIASAIPRDVTVNKRNLYKRIIDFYKVRGSADAIEIFFRLLFNDSVEVEFPYNDTLIPSSGAWDQPATVTTTTNGAVSNSNTVTIISANNNIRLSSKLVVNGTYSLTDDIRVSAIDGATITLSDAVTLSDNQSIDFVPRGIYLDNKGFLSYNIKLQDSLKYQKFSYLIKTGKNLSDWENVYDKLVHPSGFIYFAEILIFLELSRNILGDDSFDPDTLRWDELTKIIRKVLSAMPIRQPGVIGPEDIPVLVEMFASTFLPGVEAKIHKSGTLSLGLKNGVITSTLVTNGGSGYTSVPTITSSDSGTPSGFTTGSFTAVLTNGSVSLVTINDGGKDYNVPTLTIAAPSAITFDGSDDEVAGVGIVNLTDNTIKLTNDEQAALPVGALVTYDSGEGTAISSNPQLVNGTGYYIVSSTGGKVKLSEAPGGSEIDIIGVGTGTSHTFTGVTATATATKTDGQLETVTIAEPGFGYASAPAITFSGIESSPGSGVNPSVTIGITSDGELDDGNITINSTGGGWSNLFATPAANPNAGSVATVRVFGKADKKYTTAPTVVFPQPTAKDAEGNPLSSNQLAVANFNLDSEGEITGITITNTGSGYVSDPLVTLGSAVNNEVRVADQQEILVLSLNHNDVNTLITEVKINPVQSTGSQDGKTLFDNGRIRDGVIGIVNGVSIGAGGSGYSSATVTFSGGGATVQATGTVTLTGDAVSGISITSGGYGYTSAPTVTITGDGLGATATATVNLNWTISQSSSSAAEFLPEHRVKVVNSNFRTIINNGYLQRKGSNNFYTTARAYNTNQTIEFLGNNTLETIDSSVINKYNTRTFVEIE